MPFEARLPQRPDPLRLDSEYLFPPSKPALRASAARKPSKRVDAALIDTATSAPVASLKGHRAPARIWSIWITHGAVPQTDE
jgi:hypothetical protein